MTALDGRTPPALLALSPADACHVLRLDAFRAGHPEWVIGSGTGFWQARMSEPDAETIITRYSLSELLDKLEGREPPPG
jgi:hypothetical protein